MINNYELLILNYIFNALHDFNSHHSINMGTLGLINLKRNRKVSIPGAAGHLAGLRGEGVHLRDWRRDGCSRVAARRRAAEGGGQSAGWTSVGCFRTHSRVVPGMGGLGGSRKVLHWWCVVGGASQPGSESWEHPPSIPTKAREGHRRASP